MAQQTIGIGAAPNDGTGDPARTAFTKCNDNFTELYTNKADLASPTLVTPNIGTPSAGTLTNCTGLPVSTGVSGLGTGVATALAVNVGSAGAPVVNGGALGTPSSGTLTNCTGIALTGCVTGTLSSGSIPTEITTSAVFMSGVANFSGTDGVYANVTDGTTTVSLSLGAGTWQLEIVGSATLQATSGYMYAKLRNVTDSTDAIGVTSIIAKESVITTFSMQNRVTLSGTKTLTLQFCTNFGSGYTTRYFNVTSFIATKVAN